MLKILKLQFPTEVVEPNAQSAEIVGEEVLSTKPDIGQKMEIEKSSNAQQLDNSCREILSTKSVASDKMEEEEEEERNVVLKIRHL